MRAVVSANVQPKKWGCKMHLSKCSRCGEHLVANFWKPRKTRNPPTAQNTAFPAPRSQSWRAVHNTLPPPPARHKTPWPWCQRPVTDSILPGRCVRGIARGTPSPAQRKGSGMAGESGARPRPPYFLQPGAHCQGGQQHGHNALPAAGGVGVSVPSTGRTTALVLFPLLIYHPTSAFNAAREEAGRPW